MIIKAKSARSSVVLGNLKVAIKSFVHNSLFAAQDHSTFDTMTTTMVPLIITTDSSGNS